MTDTNKTFATVEAAARYVKNIKGKVRFQLMVHVFLPTTEGRGFPGQTCITVSRTQFIEAVRGMGTTLVDERGGKIVLRIDKSYGLIYVAMY